MRIVIPYCAAMYLLLMCVLTGSTHLGLVNKSNLNSMKIEREYIYTLWGIISVDWVGRGSTTTISGWKLKGQVTGSQ